MQNEGQYVPAEAGVLAAGLEDQLLATIHKTTQDIAHSECFDDEQRAEVYTILQTIKADTTFHRQLVGRWVSHLPGAKSDA